MTYGHPPAHSSPGLLTRTGALWDAHPFNGRRFVDWKALTLASRFALPPSTLYAARAVTTLGVHPGAVRCRTNMGAMMDRNEAERILTALKSGTPLVSRHKSAEALEWAMGPRWISVDERMPEDGRHVLGYVIDGGLVLDGHAAMIDIVAFFAKRGFVQFTGNDDDAVTITHWQPLPASPGVRDE